MLNREVFHRDPLEFTIPNQGVARVERPNSPEDWQKLDYELKSFVCKGAYARGMNTILDQYLAHVDAPAQPAVWVSGFYGSGKSHFARVLEHVWRDTEFPDGETARSKVDLTKDITDKLRELSTVGKKNGGLWSAAGTLSAASSTDTVRMKLLSIIFQGAGLPTQYSRARFAMYLMREGVYDIFEQMITDAGRDFETEMANFQVSKVLHGALLNVLPEFASSQAKVGELLRSSFPTRSDISTDDLTETVEEVLKLTSVNGKTPMTLVIFDEVQQFIGEDPQRTLAVQEAVEALSHSFGGKILFVATGQLQLGSTPALGKLKDRFTIKVELDNTDVERVVREVVFRKKQKAEGEVRSVLDGAAGEIARQLNDTKLAVTGEDQAHLVADYPLLPSRARFWEDLLRAINAAGTSGQLRTQLRIALETTKGVAREPVGTVIAGDAIFDQIKNDLMQGKLLTPEMVKTISDLDNGTADGELKKRLAMMAFLIDQLPKDGTPLDKGLRSTVGAMTDLLIQDLTGSNAHVRSRVQELLDELAASGTLMQADGEYRLQTAIGRKWELDFRKRVDGILSDTARLADERQTLLRAKAEAEIGKKSIVQGVSKEPRTLDFWWNAAAPALGDKIPIWIRDGWMIDPKHVLAEARQAGQESSVVFVAVPQRHHEELARAIAETMAAEETLNANGSQSTDEGRQARSAMESRKSSAQSRRDRLIKETLDAAQVWKGGGAEVSGGLRDAVSEAATDAAQRLYPNFKAADSANWEKARSRAADGNGDALKQVGYPGGVEEHPVVSAVLKYVGNGRKGSAVREHFQRPPFGWPQDAVDTALILLTLSGNIRAMRSGRDVTAKDLANKKEIAGTDFAGEDVVITKAEYIDLRSLMAKLGITVKTDEEVRERAGEALTRLEDAAAAAGGDAPAPAAPSVSMIHEVRSNTGNGRLKAMYEAREDLADAYKRWTHDRDELGRRLPRWSQLQKLIGHGESLPALDALRAERDAILDQRSLLAEPDPTTPLIKQASTVLREAVTAAHRRLVESRAAALAGLQATPEWNELSDTEWTPILAQQGLGPLPDLEVGDDTHLLRTLDSRPLEGWASESLSMQVRAAKAHEEAARRIRPEAVKITLPSATFTTEAEVDAWLDAQRKKIVEQIAAGKPVMV